MRLFLFLAFLSASIWHSIADPAPPTLAIGWVAETSSPLTLSPLGSAFVPVIVEPKVGIISVPAAGVQFTVSIVCSNEPLLAVEITAQPGHTNQLEWSTDLFNWEESNVFWISEGQPVRYYLTQPVGGRSYRVNEWNSSPLGRMVVFPVTGALFSLSALGNSTALARMGAASQADAANLV